MYPPILLEAHLKKHKWSKNQDQEVIVQAEKPKKEDQKAVKIKKTIQTSEKLQIVHLERVTVKG